jgi:hypothetical protein
MGGTTGGTTGGSAGTAMSREEAAKAHRQAQRETIAPPMRAQAATEEVAEVLHEIKNQLTYIAAHLGRIANKP